MQQQLRLLLLLPRRRDLLLQQLQQQQQLLLLLQRHVNHLLRLTAIPLLAVTLKMIHSDQRSGSRGLGGPQ